MTVGNGYILFLCVKGLSEVKLDNFNSAPIDNTVKRSKKKTVEHQIHSMIQPPGRFVTEHPVMDCENDYDDWMKCTLVLCFTMIPVLK